MVLCPGLKVCGGFEPMTELTCSSITGFFSASRQVYNAGTFCVILCWNYCRLVHFVANVLLMDTFQ